VTLSPPVPWPNMLGGTDALLRAGFRPSFLCRPLFNLFEFPICLARDHRICIGHQTSTFPLSAIKFYLNNIWSVERHLTVCMPSVPLGVPGSRCFLLSLWQVLEVNALFLPAPPCLPFLDLTKAFENFSLFSLPPNCSQRPRLMYSEIP